MCVCVCECVGGGGWKGQQNSKVHSKKFSAGGGGLTYSVKQPVRRWINPLATIESQLGPPECDTLDPTIHRWELECRVKFYVNAKVVQLWHPFSRYLFYLQLRDNLQCGHVPVSAQTAVTLAGLGSQYVGLTTHLHPPRGFFFLVWFSRGDADGVPPPPICGRDKALPSAFSLSLSLSSV